MDGNFKPNKGGEKRYQQEQLIIGHGVTPCTTNEGGNDHHKKFLLASPIFVYTLDALPTFALPTFALLQMDYT